MAEPLKLIFSPALIRDMADRFAATGPFDTDRFLAHALDGLDDLEMMQRSARIADALDLTLPRDFPTALPHLQAVLHPETTAPLDAMTRDDTGLRGWALAPVGTFVARNGLMHPKASLDFLRELTKRFTAEFAVRPFFRDHPDLTLRHAMDWAGDANDHVRRLASEGSRPRLPWGLRLARFVKDPAPLIPILWALRDDPSDYVRRSVANNLNDIARDHPDLVASLAGDWMAKAPANRRAMLKHACRGLIKAGHAPTLAVFGYGTPGDLKAELSIAPQRVKLGQSITARLSLRNDGAKPLPLLIDLVAMFRKADGRLTPKVFKWTETRIGAGAHLTLHKALPLRDVTTRRHYSGAQALAVQINGQVMGRVPFDLVVPG